MSSVRASSRLLSPPAFDVREISPRGAERRTQPRFSLSGLRHRLVARHKYGEPVTLIDLSVGGVQFETPRFVRPDVDVVLEIINARTSEALQLVSRVLRANVAGLNGGITYRAACAFRRPLADATLLVPETPPVRNDGPDYLKLELELKTIVESRFDTSSRLDALAHLRSAAERRRDPVDRQLGVLLAAMIPALQRREPADVVLRALHDHVAAQLPVLAIHTGRGSVASTHHESVTFSMGVDSNPEPISVTAEFPPGFGLDASQFRLLKLSAYLVGLVNNWPARVIQDAAAPAPPEPIAVTPEPIIAQNDTQPADLPFGWHRVVLRYMDGQLLRGYSNNFYPDRACLHLSPTLGCKSVERMLVPIARLKAVFFVKDLEGNEHRIDTQTFDHTPRGRKVQVTFRDGEVMTGSTLNYKPNEQGFFVLPASTAGNNVRAYVVNAALRHIRFV